MASYMMDQNVNVIKFVTLLVVLVLLWRGNIIKSFEFLLHRPLTTGLLNSLR
jgi:hypothetical protein